MSIRAQPAGRDIVSAPQRVAEPIVSLIGVIVLCSFFAYHQLMQTGFFTARFGPLEMLCVYVPIVLSLLAPFARAMSGYRTPSRPLEAIASVGMALATLWLLRVFPFDFTHLADALPTGLQFTVAWVNDDIGKIALLLQAVVGVLAALITMTTHLVVGINRSTRRA